MANTKPVPKRKPLFRFLIILILGILVWIVLFGCHVEILQPQKLAEAKSLWKSQNISHYKETFRVSGFFGFPCGTEVNMEVNNNQIVNMTFRGLLTPDAPFLPVTSEQITSGKLHNYTIDALFQQISSATQNIGIIDVNGRFLLDFDSRLGFPSRYQINDCGNVGLIGPSIGDCGWFVMVKSVETLD